jgi:ATP-dependent Clp protease ATP-binding subunit ClpC
METLFFFVLIGLTAAVIGYMVGRSSHQPAEKGNPAPSPERPQPVHSAEATAELHSIAAPLDAFYHAAANPSELLGHPPFEEGVALLCRPSWSVDALLGYYTGDSAPLAFLALEALARRKGDPDVRERVLAGINDYVPWTRFFSLRVLDAHTPADKSIVGELLVRLDDSWTHPSNARLIQEFLRTRAERGEKPALGDAAERLNDDRAQTLESILPRISADLAGELKAELKLWRSSSIDRNFFDCLGRVWGDDDDETEGPVLDHDALSRHVASVQASILARPRRSVLLVGEHGVGKTAIARAVGRRLAGQGWIVFEAGHAELIAGMSYLGELEERLRELLQNLRGRPILWYVPDLPALALAGRHRYGPLSVLDTVMPYIERGEIVLLGEARPGSYERLVQSKPRVLTALETWRIDPLSDASTLELVDRWAVTHTGDEIGLPARIRSEGWQLAQQYLGDRAAPGNILQLLNLTRMRLQAAGADTSLVIGADDLITTLTQLTGLPSTILDERRGLDLAALRALFEQRVLGQPEAVNCLVERVAMIKAGVTDPTRPAGVFLFAGPTGTGKTEIAKTLAEFLFGSPERMIRLDMSEFQEPESLGRILGETEEEQRGGALVDRIRKQPFSVVLLDEFEKSHSNVWDLFLQLFDDGRLTDRTGNTADFRNAIVIMTSNLGSVIPSGASLGFNDATGSFSAGAVMREIERSFRKEFLNRIDRVVVFRALGRETMREILRKELADAFRRRGLRNRAWSVEWDESALELLLEQGFTADLGARPLKRSIEHHLLAPLALTIVNHSYPEGDQFLFVRAEQGRLVVDFVDPDAEEPRVEEAGLLEEVAQRSAAETLTLGGIALDPRGRPEEIAVLQAAHERLRAVVDDASWQQSKREGLERTCAPGFWDSPDRFTVLGHVEYLDRIEAGLDSAGSLLERLHGPRGRARDRYPRELIGRLAGQVRLLEAACDGVLNGEPREAFLQVEAWSDTGQPSSDSDAFAREIGGMYRAWSDKRLMQSEVLHESGPEHDGSYRLSLAVSGFAAWRLLTPEAGLHVLEIPGGKGRREFRRAAARVRVAPQPETPAGGGPRALLEQAREIFSGQGAAGVAVVRRYREQPSPLVRDAVQGWRTGRLDRVLEGDFDLLAERDHRAPRAAS